MNATSGPLRPLLLVLLVLLVLLASSGCDDVLKPDSGDFGSADSLSDFIGSACETDDDCPYAGGLCLPHEDGLPGGMCSASCDEYCPDEDGHPTTFCIPPGQLSKPARRTFPAGACVSRCNYGAYPEGGCRAGYGCTRQKRYAQLSRETWACTPGAPEARLPQCYQELADRGVAFEADIRPPDDLAGTSRQCTIKDAIWLERSIKGVRLIYDFDHRLDRTLAACELGHALADTVQELREHDVSAITHMGTYACRTVSGTDTPSRHAFGDAIDISGFQFRDGSAYTLTDDWEHDTTRFDTDAGRWLYNRAKGWHTDKVWSVILTPNHNLAHHDHFHVDLTPGSDYMSRQTPPSDDDATQHVCAGYFGPAPYLD